jgi:VWFA-related protein
VDSTHSLEETLNLLQHSNVALYAISTTRFGANPPPGGEKLLKELAENTGGRAFFPYSSGRLEEAFDQINQELRSQYSLTYVPENRKADGSYRKVRVEVKAPEDTDIEVRHKDGYYAAVN